MSERPRPRPRFVLEVPLTAEAIGARVRAALEDPAAGVEGSVFRRTLLLTVKPAARTFWSPHLDVQLDERPGGKTVVAAMFAPHPQVWTAFLAVQIIFALLSVGAGVYWLSQLSLGGDLLVPTVVLLAMLAGGGLAFGAAFVGQGLGAGQMYELRAFLERALGEAAPPSSRLPGE